TLTFPERIYRERIPDSTGLMIIYILDTRRIFLQDPGREDPEMKELVKTHNIDLNIPIFGYAIGFPPIFPDPGGQYVKGKYQIEDDDDEADEFDELLNEAD